MDFPYAEFILYVADQQASRDFYCVVLELEPSLDVPGMTEFSLNNGAVLGLMPAAGVRRLLGDAIPDPMPAGNTPRCELYLVVQDVAARLSALEAAGGRKLSDPALRDWGHIVAYGADIDGHVLAFGAPPE